MSAGASVPFVELCGRSCFSFLEGASHPEELVHRAKELGLEGLALCDRDGIYGSVRAHTAAKKIEQRVIVGAELTIGTPRAAADRAAQRADRAPEVQPSVVLLVEDSEGYANLCRLLTIAHADCEKGTASISAEAIAAAQRGLTAIVPLDPLVPADVSGALIGALRDAFGERALVATWKHLDRRDGERVAAALAAERRYGPCVVATARPFYHHPSRKPLADVLTCIRTKTTLDQAGTRIAPNAEAYVRSGAQMAALFRDHPAWVARTVEVASRCRFSLSELRYSFPSDALCKPGETSDQALRRLTDEGCRDRYPEGTPSQVRAQIEKELALIAKLGVAPYFLSVQQVVKIARARQILCQGRGSAANSAVCFVLGVTAVDPARSNLLFERFLSEERNEPPDIDVDFEHERREEVIQAIYEMYGRDRAAMVSEVIAYRGKSALREVGKAFGFSPDQVDRLSGLVVHHEADITEQRVSEAGLDPDDVRVRQAVLMASALEGFPRHLSIHVGGFVLSSEPLHRVAPVEPARMEGRTVIPWDKDDLDDLGFFKIDVLALGMLTAIRKALALIHADRYAELARPAAHAQRAARDAAPEPAAVDAGRGAAPEEGASVGAERALAPAAPWGHAGRGAAFDPIAALAQIPPEDPAVYEAIGRADTVGVFQIESRAQMAMLPRLKPSRFYDLVIEVAIVRPGPIQGGMVHPYLRRRTGQEPPVSPHPCLDPILERTLGVPLFQEQVMQIAMVGAGYTPGEADQLRRDMAAWKKHGRLERHRGRLIQGFAERGISAKFGEMLYQQIQGFGEYGFPESHAASFALLVYASAWLKVHHQAAFTCALLNAQPMGFYSPSALVQDAQRHGVEVRPVCVVRSAWDTTLEPGAEPATGPALRLGMRLVKGLGEAAVASIMAAREDAPFKSLPDLVRRAELKKNEVEALAEAGALAAMVPARREALWRARAPRVEGLFEGVPIEKDRDVGLPPLRPLEQLALDYGRVGLSLHDHPMRHVRPALKQRRGAGRVRTAEEIKAARNGETVRVAGMVVGRQRPATASGVTFVTLEDETGVVNVIVQKQVFADHYQVARHAALLLVAGRVERQGEVIHVVARELERLELPSGEDVALKSRDYH
ncbi:DNA polymerase III subunit alpha [Sorangium sp. So ce321]|uniref:DNA polymerase III subunit alpha n=1 Tax=Sorangium sp. So ce321 TaxID=3133300 RepID=UPI003F62C062